ncbi:MAG: lamin tail domain-containing protein, partial [Anaerolineae bacterium]
PTATPGVPNNNALTVVINEVAWAGTAASFADQWIELYNTRNYAIDLAGWTLRGSGNVPLIALTGTIAANGYYLLERDDDNTLSDITADKIFSGALSTYGERLVLMNSANEIMDTANNDGGPWPGGEMSEDALRSMERRAAATVDMDINWGSNNGILYNGQDANQNRLFGTPGQLNSLSFSGATDVHYLAQLDLMTTFQDYVVTTTGSAIWTSVETGIGPPDASILIDQQIQAILVQTYAATAQNSAGGLFIVPSEAAAILALPRPAGLAQGDVQALIDRLNLTVDLWNQGLFTHAQAGRSDFIDREALTTAITRVLAAISQLELAGNSSQFSYLATFTEFRTVTTGRLAVPGDISDRSRIYYRLETGGEGGSPVLRGRMRRDGRFDIAAIAPNTFFRVSYFDPTTFSYGYISFVSERSGRVTNIPQVLLYPLEPETDTDGDGLPDVAETVVGTSSSNPDSDGDGISDWAEIQQNTDPLSGLPARTGIIASADTPGTAVDVCAFNDLVAVADSASGIALFNIYRGTNPTIIAQVNTPGSGLRVACAARYVAVADGSAGLTILDVSNPTAATILHQVSLGSAVNAVAAGGDIAYAGLANGHVAAVDMATGAVLNQSTLTTAGINDLSLSGDYLYALVNDRVFALLLDQGAMSLTGLAPSPYVAAGNKRLFVGLSTLYTIHNKGYNTFSLANPGRPVLVAASNSAQFGWRQIVDNGAGLGVAAVGAALNYDGSHNVSLYDVSNPAVTNQFLATILTPGHADAVALYNGLAYVADHNSGLQVINYLAYDSQGAPPTIDLAAGFSLNPAQAPANIPSWIGATVSDDVQVRNVEFYLDGQKVATDGAYPFAYYFTTPPLSASTFSIRARASDTGGNATWTAPVTVSLITLPPPPPPVNLTLTSTGLPASIQIGATTSFTLTVTNNGANAATNVTLSDALPIAGVEATLPTASQGTCTLNGSVATCSLGTLAPGAFATVATHFAPFYTGSIVHSAG